MMLLRWWCLLVLLAALICGSSPSFGATFSAPSSVPICQSASPSSSTTPKADPTCFDNPKSNVRYFTLVLSKIMIPGFPKPVIAVNGSYPGPTLEMNQYDIVNVLVINNLDNDTSVHFHGARQYKTPHMDGVLGLTQCPIPMNGSAVYTFCADRSGSYWYHGHRSQQYGDGLYGAYIVYPAGGDIYAPQYTHDIPILIADFYNKPTDSLLPWYLSPASAGAEPVPDAFIMNGFFSNQLSYALPSDARIRLRFISSASFSFFNISIDGYTMTIIEIDGIDTYPYEVSSFPLNVAQRVSVLVDLSKGNAWASNRNGIYIRATASVSMFDPDQVPTDINLSPVSTLYLCQSSKQANCGNILSSGLVRAPRLSSSSTSLSSMAMYTLDYTDPVYANAPNTLNDINMLDVKPLYAAYSKSNAAACYTPYYSDVQKPAYLLPLVFSFGNDPFNINRGMFNGISFDPMKQYHNLYQAPMSSPMPALYDMVIQGSPYYNSIVSNMAQNWASTAPTDLSNDIAGLFSGLPISPDQVNYIANTYNSTAPQSSDNWNLLSGNALGQYLLPGNSTVELLIINTDVGSHPIHLHGYSFWIIASSDVPTIQAPYLLRDVLSLPPNGWIKIRIQTDNPGVWALHCHISWHFDAGLGAVLIDNLPALQSDPAFSYKALIPADHAANCAAYNPVEAPPPLSGGCVSAVATDNDFAFSQNVQTSAKWAMSADLVIMAEAFVGLLFYKLRVLDYMLIELICINIGTLVGAVFIEFLKELYEQIEIAKSLTYVNVTIVMCVGFLFPFMTEKFIKRGRTGKFRVLTQKRAAAQKAAEAQKADDADNTGSGDSGKKDSNSNDKNDDYMALATPTSASGMSTPPTNNLERQTSAVALLPLIAENDEMNNEVVFHVGDMADTVKVSEKKKSMQFEGVTVATVSMTKSLSQESPESPEVRSERALSDPSTAPEGLSLLERHDSNAATTRPPSSTITDTPTIVGSSNQVVATMKPLQLDTLSVPEKKQESKKANGHRRESSSMEKLAKALAKPKADWNLIFIVLAGEALDTFVDGGVIAAAFLAGSGTGLASALGVFMEELTHMTGSFAVFVAAGASVWKCVMINCLSAIFLMMGSGFILAAASIPGINAASIDYLLAFAAGTYLYVGLVDLTALITSQPWTGWKRAIAAVGSVAFGIGIQAAIAVYHWKSGTS